MVGARRLLSIAVGMVMLTAAMGTAQVADKDGTFTLHVYTNLIQIPTLVLSRLRTPLPPIAEGRFYVSLDGGPQFKATHVRVQGEDPISLGILLDMNGETAKLMPGIEQAVAGLVPGSLTGKDRVSIYALDCMLVRTAKGIPAESGALTRAVEAALKPWAERKAQKNSKCKETVHLWDALAMMTQEMQQAPGRRVILALTDGEGEGSKWTWGQTRAYAQGAGVAVFALNYIPVEFSGENEGMIRRGSPLASVCELSGGMVMQTVHTKVGKDLAHFVALVRGRYIVEFPRPRNEEAGSHSMEVTIAKMAAFIRPAGASMALMDPAIANDPNTVKGDESTLPVMGTRKVPPKGK